ncbi:FAD-binding protein [Nonomuraea sp. MCN248]|uniref:FAD-binding protein n=1 Tax=Nonomuraea corallina TaxID=2989783 RepID=A0ABT4S6G6_9ACTN|nr:FAD-binding protein [Nonomuraea corallina]MDA0632788.1 FAD-binding protein [Nonomuraea corallina]
MTHLIVDKADPRYPDLARRGINARFPASPAKIVLPGETAQVVRAVQEAVGAGERLAVRSGGHCFEALVDHPGTQTVLDLSEMKAVGLDPETGAFAVEPGATLGSMYRTLFLRWGVTVPAGRCPEIGVGGHVPGGGGGALSRRHGLSVDHLYGVEMVVVDDSGRARAVRATREPDDPHRDLWWACTGGGAGGFGVVTRFLFRLPGSERVLSEGALSERALSEGALSEGALSEGALSEGALSEGALSEGALSEGALPAPPAAVTRRTLRWQWADLDEDGFVALVRAFSLWHERNSGPGAPGALLDNSLTLPRAGGGPITLETAAEDGGAGPEVAAAFVAEVCRAVRATPETEVSTSPFLAATLVPDEYAGVRGRFKSKAAFLRSSWPEDTIAGLYRRLTDESSYRNPAAAFYLLSHGGAINAVGPADTAMAHRDAVLKAYGSVFWWDTREDDVHLSWIRETYHELFAGTGGVPDPDRGHGGAFVNYADADFTDPGLNGSGVPWHRLYFRDNYPRLQRVKARFDPLDVFRHALSVRLP